MIGWVDGMGDDWGKVKRNRLWDDGLPPSNIIIALLSGRGGFEQRFAEVMMDLDMVTFDRAVACMEHEFRRQWAVMWGKYVFQLSERRMGAHMNLKHYEIRSLVDQAHGFVAAKMQQANNAA